MIYPQSETFKNSVKKGEWRKRNGKWYKAIYKLEWEVYSTQICPVCHKEFLTRHQSQTCSKQCRAKLYWKNLPLTERRKPRYVHKSTGYVYITLFDGKVVAEHRHIMEQLIGRPIKGSEQVHHINGKRADNRPENLVLLTLSGHNIIHKPLQARNWPRDDSGKFV